MSRTILILWLAGCGGRSHFDSRGDTDDPIGEPGDPAILDMRIAEARMDVVAPADDGLHPDGESDAAFQVTVRGPLVSLALLTTGDDGASCCGQQWDTVVRDEPIPSGMASGFSSGAETWVLGVSEDDVLWNRADGSLETIGPEEVDLVLHASASGYFCWGNFFQARGETEDGEVLTGPVVEWTGDCI
jgi:hypothetical protein